MEMKEQVAAVRQEAGVAGADMKEPPSPPHTAVAVINPAAAAGGETADPTDVALTLEQHQGDGAGSSSNTAGSFAGDGAVATVANADHGDLGTAEGGKCDAGAAEEGRAGKGEGKGEGKGDERQQQLNSSDTTGGAGYKPGPNAGTGTTGGGWRAHAARARGWLAAAAGACGRGITIAEPFMVDAVSPRLRRLGTRDSESQGGDSHKHRGAASSAIRAWQIAAAVLALALLATILIAWGIHSQLCDFVNSYLPIAEIWRVNPDSKTTFDCAPLNMSIDVFLDRRAVAPFSSVDVYFKNPVSSVLLATFRDTNWNLFGAMAQYAVVPSLPAWHCAGKRHIRAAAEVLARARNPAINAALLQRNTDALTLIMREKGVPRGLNRTAACWTAFIAAQDKLNAKISDFTKSITLGANAALNINADDVSYLVPSAAAFDLARRAPSDDYGDYRDYGGADYDYYYYYDDNEVPPSVPPSPAGPPPLGGANSSFYLYGNYSFPTPPRRAPPLPPSPAPPSPSPPPPDSGWTTERTPVQLDTKPLVVDLDFVNEAMKYASKRADTSGVSYNEVKGSFFLATPPRVAGSGLKKADVEDINSFNAKYSTSAHVTLQAHVDMTKVVNRGPVKNGRWKSLTFFSLDSAEVNITQGLVRRFELGLDVKDTALNRAKDSLGQLFRSHKRKRADAFWPITQNCKLSIQDQTGGLNGITIITQCCQSASPDDRICVNRLERVNQTLYDSVVRNASMDQAAAQYSGYSSSERIFGPDEVVEMLEGLWRPNDTWSTPSAAYRLYKLWALPVTFTGVDVNVQELPLSPSELAAEVLSYLGEVASNIGLRLTVLRQQAAGMPTASADPSATAAMSNAAVRREIRSLYLGIKSSLYITGLFCITTVCPSVLSAIGSALGYWFTMMAAAVLVVVPCVLAYMAARQARLDNAEWNEQHTEEKPHRVDWCYFWCGWAARWPWCYCYRKPEEDAATCWKMTFEVVTDVVKEDEEQQLERLQWQLEQLKQQQQQRRKQGGAGAQEDEEEFEDAGAGEEDTGDVDVEAPPPPQKWEGRTSGKGSNKED